MVVRENNNSCISNESEYFIVDIEATKSFARFDMIAIRWLASQRKIGYKCKPALIEMKYSDSGIKSSAGLLKHLKDMETLVTNKEEYLNLLKTMQSQFKQLNELGLLKYNKGTSNAEVELSSVEIPEVIFILANHNPRSPLLKEILSDPEFERYANSEHFDIRFFVSSFAGYGMHSQNVKTLQEFLKLL